MLERIKSYFGVGKIYEEGENICRYMVTKPKELIVILDHFDKFPLISQKRTNFDLFKEAVKILIKKEHLTIEGVHKLIAIKASMSPSGARFIRQVARSLS